MRTRAGEGDPHPCHQGPPTVSQMRHLIDQHTREAHRVTEAEPKRRRRRKKPKPRICCREGCNRDMQPNYEKRPACSFLCAVVVQELERAQRLCEALGGDTEHWLAVVAL